MILQYYLTNNCTYLSTHEESSIARKQGEAAVYAFK